MSYNGSSFNRYRQNRPKVDASIFDSALRHFRRSDASEKKEEKYSRPLLDAFACEQVSIPRLYRLRFQNLAVLVLNIHRDHIFYKLNFKVGPGTNIAFFGSKLWSRKFRSFDNFHDAIGWHFCRRPFGRDFLS